MAFHAHTSVCECYGIDGGLSMPKSLEAVCEHQTRWLLVKAQLQFHQHLEKRLSVLDVNIPWFDTRSSSSNSPLL